MITPLLTGAAGGVAGMVRPLLLDHFANTILSDRATPADMQPGEEFRACDLGQPDQVTAMLDGVAHLIHLGAQGTEGTWDEVLNSNIIGLHNLYEAARIAGVKRIVYASSVHAIGFYPRDRRLTPAVRTRPDSRYGVSKVFGEALAALYADKHGIGTLSVRIGNINPKPIDERRLSIWLHPADFVQLCGIGLTHPGIHNQVVWGTSDNTRAWWDNQVAHDLGYRPKYNSETFAEQALAANAPADLVGDLLQGGTFCSDEFSGDMAKVLNA